jgi:hypothetical protein
MSFIFNEDGGIVILAGAKILYSSKENTIKTAKPNNVVKIRASAKAKRVVEYPIFDKMMEYETDMFWKSLFDEAATGKFPRNFKYQNSTLNYKIRSKNVEYVIEESKPEEAMQITKRFLLEHAGIQSPEDRRRKKIEEEKRISEMLMNESIHWSQIRSERQRMIMISLFVESLGRKYNLIMEERKGLVQNIRIGILSGYLNSENIEIIGNSIVDIRGLEYNEIKKEFEINKDQCKLSKINRKHNIDTADPTLTYEQDESPCGDVNMDQDGSSHSSQSLKKRFTKFLSDISKK